MPLAGFKEFFKGRRQSRPNKPTHAIVARHDPEKKKTILMLAKFDHSNKRFGYDHNRFDEVKHTSDFPQWAKNPTRASSPEEEPTVFGRNLNRAVEKMARQIPNIKGQIPLVHNLTRRNDMLPHYYGDYTNAKLTRR